VSLADDWDDYWDQVDAAAAPRPSPGVAGWRQRSAAGAIAAAVLIGIQEALEPERRDEAVVEVGLAPADPVGDVELRFDEGSPRRTVAVVRHGPPNRGAGDGAVNGAAPRARA
jgi:hypothetical protein